MPGLLRILAIAGVALATCAFAKGERQPAEHAVFTAPESGLEVVQLTTHAADDAVLYFTGESFTAGGQGLVFASRRTGSWNLFLMDLRTFSFVQLTDSRKISGPTSVVAPGSRELFFRDGPEVKALSLDNLGERTVTRIPDGYYLGAALSATPDGSALAFAVSENIPIEAKNDKIYADMDERFEKRPWSTLLTGRGNGSGWHEVARQKKWISHTLISPSDPDLILYCHEGRWNKVEQRMWLVRADDTGNRALRVEESPSVSIGHEYWFDDGVHVGYHGYDSGPRKAFVGIADVRTGGFVEHILPQSEMHTHASPDGTLFIGDGTEAKPVLTLYRLAGERLEGKPLWRHGGSFSRQEWHPHPRFAPDGRSVVFTSSRAGAGDVYLIRLPPP